jgi:FtsH-binding integral membrane protein
MLTGALIGSGGLTILMGSLADGLVVGVSIVGFVVVSSVLGGGFVARRSPQESANAGSTITNGIVFFMEPLVHL